MNMYTGASAARTGCTYRRVRDQADPDAVGAAVEIPNTKAFPERELKIII
jgi:hypothetical protein